MLELKDIHKTFNPGTINEKVALKWRESPPERRRFLLQSSVEMVPVNLQC